MDTIASSLERAQVLESRIADCEKLLAHATAFCNARWVPNPPTFCDVPHSNTNTPHVVNTSSSLSVIARASDLFNWDLIKPFSHFTVAETLNFYVHKDSYDAANKLWVSQRFNHWSPYVTAVSLLAISDVLTAALRRAGTDEAKRSDIVSALNSQVLVIIREQAEKLLRFLDAWGTHKLPADQLDYDHAFFAYNAIEALTGLSRLAQTEINKDGAVKPLHATVVEDFFPGDADTLYKTAMHNALSHLHKEFFRHMTFAQPCLTPHIDAATLGLSLYCLATRARSIPGATNTAMYELPDDVLDVGLDAFFDRQQPTGFWDTTTPLLGAATGRVGCSSIELATRFLTVPRVAARFQDFAPHFDRLLTQLIRGFDAAHPGEAWPVDIRRNGNERQTWYGFFAFEYVNMLAGSLRDAAAELILKGFRYRRAKPKRLWSDLMLSEKPKARVTRRVIETRRTKGKGAPACSMILFGPPGTGKTSFASAIAHELGWGLIEIGPGDFLRNGINNLFEQGDLIFQRLLLLSRVVVLFDEIDEFVAERTADADKVSKFITTYMLPWVQRLRDRATLVFIFATNHLESFDPAIRRPGRFDLIVPIAPVAGVQRIDMMTGMQLGLNPADIAKLEAQLLPQTTYGDIERARDEIRDDEGDPDGARPATKSDARVAKFTMKLQESQLITKDEEWKAFMTLAEAYMK